jgi:uncharacterized repeat protein (TIGR01451 family)
VVAPPGGVVTYTVVLKNLGPAAAPATLTDTSLGGGTFHSAGSTIPMGCTAPVNGTANPTISCSFPLVGANQQVTLIVAITTTNSPGTQSNNADAAVPPNALNILDGDDTNNHATASTDVKALADAGVTVDGPDGAVLAESTITYAVTATNYGPSSTVVSLDDDSTGGGTYIASASTVPAGCTGPADGTPDPSFACTFSLEPGSSATLIVGIQTTSSPGTQSNAATVSVANNAVDNNDDNDAATAVTTVEKRADLAVSVTGPATVTAGSLAAFLVTLTNNGPSTTDATLSDVSTGGGAFNAAASSIPPECTAPDDGTIDPTISCSFTGIAAGGERQLTVALVVAYANPTQTNTAIASAPSDVIDGTPANNTDTFETVVQTVADLAVTATGSPNEVSPVGGGLLHFVTARNDGPSTTDITLLIDTTGGGALNLGSSVIPSGCTAPANGTIDPSITCTFTGAESGDSFLVRVALKTSTTPGTQSTTASVSVPENVTDPAGGNNTVTLNTSVLNNPNGSFAFVPTGGTLGFGLSTLTASNAPNGVIALLAPAAANGAMSGTVPCDNGLLVDFDPNPDFQGTVTLLLDFGRGNPCRGLGNGSECWKLYMRKLGVVFQVPLCKDAPDADVCIEQVRKRSDAPNIQWVVRLDSTDPEFLPPLNRSVS